MRTGDTAELGGDATEGGWLCDRYWLVMRPLQARDATVAGS